MFQSWALGGGVSVELGCCPGRKTWTQAKEELFAQSLLNRCRLAPSLRAGSSAFDGALTPVVPSSPVGCFHIVKTFRPDILSR